MHTRCSAPTAALTLPVDGSVSPLHAHLRFVENEWYLSDAGSANGTHLLVEDSGRAIGVGDSFRIARTEIEVLAVPDRYS